MEKLIELLNEYEVEKKPSRLQKNYYLGFVHNFGKGIMYIDEEGEDIDDYRTDYEIISKEYGFIKWLVDNDKIDFESENYPLKKYYPYFSDDILAIVGQDCNTYEDRCKVCYDKYESLLMLLAISDTPIDDLISYLK